MVVAVGRLTAAVVFFTQQQSLSKLLNETNNEVRLVAERDLLIIKCEKSCHFSPTLQHSPVLSDKLCVANFEI